VDAVGVDIGGTWIRAAVIRSDGVLEDVVRTPTGRERPADEVVGDIVATIERADAGSLPVGVGAPTTLDSRGRLEPCPNLPTLVGLPLGELLAERLGRDVVTENDAACFALGEWRHGAGRGASLLVGVTLGTGIGVGIVLEGRLVRGAHGRSGEIWHSPVDLRCDAGSCPHVEALVSGVALESAYAQHAPTPLPGPAIAALAQRGDRPAQKAFESLGAALGGVLIWISDLLDPDVIVLGGSVSDSWDLIEPAVIRRLGERPLRLVVSELGQRAALQGAATVALAELERRRMV